MYLRLKDILNEGCKKMPYAIFYFIDNDENKENNTYYRLFFDCFKNIELICHAIDIKAYTQAGLKPQYWCHKSIQPQTRAC